MGVVWCGVFVGGWEGSGVLSVSVCARACVLVCACVNECMRVWGFFIAGGGGGGGEAGLAPIESGAGDECEGQDVWDGGAGLVGQWG